MELVAGQSRLDRSFGRHHRILKDIEEQIQKLMAQFQKTSVDSDQIVQHMQIQYPESYEEILQPPEWIRLMKSVLPADDGGGWQRTGRNGRAELEDDSMYAYWRSGQDLNFLRSIQTYSPPSQSQPTQEHLAPNQNSFALLPDDAADSDETRSLSDYESCSLSDQESDTDDGPPEERWKREWPASPPTYRSGALVSGPSSLMKPASAPVPWIHNPAPDPASTTIKPSDLQNPAEFFAHFGFDDVPPVPSSDRPLDFLLGFGDIWLMSQSERNLLHAYWTEQVRTNLQQTQIEVRTTRYNPPAATNLYHRNSYRILNNFAGSMQPH
jgi:hypothetical protein